MATQLIYDEEKDLFVDPETGNEYEIEVEEQDIPDFIDEMDELDDYLTHIDYLDFDDEENAFVDEDSGKALEVEFDDDQLNDFDYEKIEFEDENDDDELTDFDYEKVGYKMNIRRRRPQRGINRVKSKNYYRKHKPQIGRKQKLYKTRNRVNLRTRVKKIHHPTSHH